MARTNSHFAEKFVGRTKDILPNRIEHEYICRDTDVVINGRF